MSVSRGLKPALIIQDHPSFISTLPNIIIKKDELSFYQISGYTTFIRTRETTRGGGILIYAKNGLSFDAQTVNTKAHETLHGQLKIGKNITHIVAIYRPPKNNKLIFMEQLENTVRSIPASDNVVVIGDTNINLINHKVNPTTTKYKNILCAYGLQCAIPSAEITREAIVDGRLVASCLDHVWVRAGRSECGSSSYVLEAYISDHHAVGITLDLGDRNVQVNSGTGVREVISDKLVTQKLDAYDWAQLLIITCPLILFETLCTVFDRIYKESIVTVTIYVIYLALCSLTQAVYISRMSSVNRLRPPTPFRPGINLQRPWAHTRLVQAASHRAPYVLYRKPPQRYAVKHFAPSATRNLFAGGPWKTSGRLPPLSPVTEYDFIKAASAAPVVHTDGGTGAIHTIPAPNLSLSEKPIVVVETSDSPVSEQPRPSYEVTEKYPETEYRVAKIESPIGFSKSTSFTTPELQTLIRNGAALQLASEYSLPALSINQHQHQAVHHQYPLQGFQSALPTQQDLVNTGVDGVFIPPNALYQHDPMFLQKLQSQLLQRFPSVEFIPYAAEAPNQVHLQPEASQIHTQVVHPQMIHPQVLHTQVIHPQELQPQMILLENEQLDKPIYPQNNEQKTVVQRDTQENTVVTLVPQSFIIANITEKQAEVTPPPQQENITEDLVAAETQPPTTTVKYIVETSSEDQNTTPIYYAQIGQSVGSIIANGFYSAINDVRAAAALAQEETPIPKSPENVTTTTISSNLKGYFVKNDEKSENKTATHLKPLLGVPFAKPSDSVNVAYTLLRADDKQPKVNQEGAVYAGQIVEATISEDQDFNKEKASMISRRAPIRLFAVAETKNIANSANTLPEVTMVKAKISPKSKLTFDDKTGEPILRIYASYVDSSAQKDALVSKLANLKQAKDAVARKEAVDNWKVTAVKAAAEKNQGFDANQVTQFGLKLRERNDYYEPFFEDYEDL